jgi:hypothetical protein
MYLEGILMYVKYKNVFLVVDRCILRDTKVFECFSMHLVIFVVYFKKLVVYFNVTSCI